MRQSDGLPPDPDVLAELETIDATLAGLAIDPAYAEIAELTLLLADERPRIAPEFGRELDARVQRRFAPSGGERGGAGRRRRVSSLLRAPAFTAGLAAVLAATVVAVVIVQGSGGLINGTERKPPVVNYGAATQSPTRAEHPRSGSFGTNGTATVSGTGAVLHASGGSASSTATNSASHSAKSSPAASAPAAAPSAAALTTAGVPAPVSAPAPAGNGRRIVQSAQLQLSTSNAHLDLVSQEVFDVVGQENGIVRSSSVTSGSGGYATFSLNIPSQNLQTTMTRLSALRYATVASRTDQTQDVNDQYLNDQRRLADARALRTSLLKQLAAATTQAEIDSLTAQLHDAEASIASREATLNGLQGRINYSALTVQINPGPVIVPVRHVSSSSFTIGKAAHDAVRVLTVAAGVGLIVLAALIPFGLVAAFVAWIAYRLRRRRREHALDSV